MNTIAMTTTRFLGTLLVLAAPSVAAVPQHSGPLGRPVLDGEFALFVDGLNGVSDTMHLEATGGEAQDPVEIVDSPWGCGTMTSLEPDVWLASFVSGVEGHVAFSATAGMHEFFFEGGELTGLMLPSGGGLSLSGDPNGSYVTLGGGIVIWGEGVGNVDFRQFVVATYSVLRAPAEPGGPIREEVVPEKSKALGSWNGGGPDATPEERTNGAGQGRTDGKAVYVDAATPGVPDYLLSNEAGFTTQTGAVMADSPKPSPFQTALLLQSLEDRESVIAIRHELKFTTYTLVAGQVTQVTRWTWSQLIPLPEFDPLDPLYQHLVFETAPRAQVSSQNAAANYDEKHAEALEDFEDGKFNGALLQ